MARLQSPKAIGMYAIALGDLLELRDVDPNYDDELDNQIADLEGQLLDEDEYEGVQKAQSGVHDFVDLRVLQVV